MRKELGLSMLSKLLLVGGIALGQTSPAKLAFDVDTVKPAAPLDLPKLAAQVKAGNIPRIGRPIYDGSRAEYTYMSLKDLIAVAYSVQSYQVSGPEWLASQRFDIVAKLPDGTTKDDAPAMLQALLQERFKLVAHRDSQEHAALALVVAKGGPKLKASSGTPTPIDSTAPLKPGETNIDTIDGPARATIHPDGSTTINMGVKGTVTQRMDMQNQVVHLNSDMVTMQGFSEMLARLLQMAGGGGKQVVNMTGLTGYYQVAVELSLADAINAARAQGVDIPRSGGGGDNLQGNVASDPGGGLSVFQSVQALGLKLESRKAKVDLLVVDSVQKVPTEN
jgi:uncharacterized protein (TIGR03435 family)